MKSDFFVDKVVEKVVIKVCVRPIMCVRKRSSLMPNQYINV